MEVPPPIPAELWGQVPPAAQAAILLLLLLDKSQDRRLGSGRYPALEVNRDRRNRRHTTILRPLEAGQVQRVNEYPGGNTCQPSQRLAPTRRHGRGLTNPELGGITTLPRLFSASISGKTAGDEQEVRADPEAKCPG